MPKIFKRKFGKLREKILLPFTRNSQLRVSLPEFVSSNQKRTRQMGLGNSGTKAHKMHKYYLQAWYYSTFLDMCHQIPKLSPNRLCLQTIAGGRGWRQIGTGRQPWAQMAEKPDGRRDGAHRMNEKRSMVSSFLRPIPMSHFIIYLIAQPSNRRNYEVAEALTLLVCSTPSYGSTQPNSLSHA